jgi:hypothetical protein
MLGVRHGPEDAFLPFHHLNQQLALDESSDLKILVGLSDLKRQGLADPSVAI